MHHNYLRLTHVRNFFTNYVLCYATWLLVIYINVRRFTSFIEDEHPDEHSVYNVLYNLIQPVFISMLAYRYLYKEKNPLHVLSCFGVLKLFDFIGSAIIFCVASHGAIQQVIFKGLATILKVPAPGKPNNFNIFFANLACFVLVLVITKLTIATWLLVIYINVTGLHDFWIDNDLSIYEYGLFNYNIFQPVFISMCAYIFLYREKKPLHVLSCFGMLNIFGFIFEYFTISYVATRFVLVIGVAIFIWNVWQRRRKRRLLQQQVERQQQRQQRQQRRQQQRQRQQELPFNMEIVNDLADLALLYQSNEGLPDLKELELSTNIKNVDDPNDVCAICLEDFYDRSNITCQLNCKHFYHVECLKKQRKVSVNPIRDKCPMCCISYDTVVQQVYVEKPKKKVKKETTKEEAVRK